MERSILKKLLNWKNSPYRKPLILNKLLEWKNSPYRKPLILKGVRQAGKT